MKTMFTSYSIDKVTQLVAKGYKDFTDMDSTDDGRNPNGMDIIFIMINDAGDKIIQAMGNDYFTSRDVWKTPFISDISTL